MYLNNSLLPNGSLQASERMDALEIELDKLINHVKVNIKLELMEVDILLKDMEARHQRILQKGANKSE